MSTSVSKLLVKIENHIIQCSFKEALDLIAAFEKNKDIKKDDLLACKILKCDLLNKTGRHPEAIKLADEIIGASEKPKFIISKLDGLLQKSEALWSVGSIREHLGTIQICSQIVANLDKLPANLVDKRKANLQNLKMAVPYVRGEYELAIEYGKQGVEYAEQSKEKLVLARLNNGLAMNYKQLGKMKDAMDYFDNAINLAEEVENKQEVAFALAGKAILQIQKRNFEKAIELRIKAIDMNEETGALRDLPYIYHNLGNIYSRMHELDLALESYLKFFSFLGENIIGAQVPLSNTGYIYYRKGDLKTALVYYLKALKVCEASGDQRRILPRVLYNLIKLSIDLKDNEQAQKHLEHLKLISDLAENEEITRMYSFASGFVKQASSRMSDWSKALEIFQEELKKKNQPTYWKIVALINISEVLMRELHMTGELVIFNELKRQIKDLINIAEEGKYFMLLAEAYWLQAQLDLAELNIDDAKKNLKRASKITENKGLVKLAKDILLEQEKLENQLNTWEGFAKEKKPLVEALKHLTLEDGIKKVSKETVLERLDQKTGETIEYKTIFALKIT